jgi:glycosyltransferase 2 family protein
MILMKWDKIRKFLPIVGISIFVYLLIKLDITKVFGEFKTLNWNYLSIALILMVVFFTTQTLKWFVIARRQKITVPFKEAFKINLISSFYGFVTPSKVGSIVRMNYLKKYGGDTGKGISNFIVDKVLDLSSLFILVVGFGLLINQKLVSENYFYFVLAMFIAMVSFFLIFYKKSNTQFLLKWIYRKFIPERLKDKTRTLFESFYRDMPSLGFLIFAFGINLLNWIVNYTVLYFTSLALGIDVKFSYFLIILPISTLVAQIPITINGLGTRELTMISLFGILGISAVKVFSMSLLSIVITNIIPSILAIIFLLKKEPKHENEIHDIKTV